MNNYYNKNRYASNNNFKKKEPKKDWRRRTTHQKNGLKKNLAVEVPVSCMGVTKDGKYFSGISFINIMDQLQIHKVFSMISIPIYISYSYINGDPDCDWTTPIGYIKYFKDTADAGIVIYRKSIKFFEKIKNPLIVPRVALNEDETVKTIIGLDVMERSKIAMFEKQE